MTTSPEEPVMHGGVISGRPIVARAWERCCVARHLPMAFVFGPEDDPAGVSTVMAHPSGALVDLDTTPASWIDALGSDRRLRLVVLSPPVPSPSLRRLLARGCRSLITTHDHLRTLDEAMAALLLEEPFVSPSGLRLLFETCGAPPTGSAPGPVPALSPRERDVLWAMVDGSTIKATSRALGVAVKTVEGHRRSIFTKLGVGNQTEAIARALSDPGVLGGRPTTKPSHP